MITMNRDRAISARDYAQFGGKILWTSMFATIQGEGPMAGLPAVFLRLSGCNYGDKQKHCAWCDTDFRFDRGTGHYPAALLLELLKVPGYHPSMVLVITGGEPTLQLALLDLIEKARQYFKAIQIETNGTQPKFFNEAAERDLLTSMTIVVSPKAGPTGYKQLPEETISAATCFKFVVSADPLDPHHRVPHWAWATNKTVYISPMAVYKREYAGEVSSVWDPTLVDHEATSHNYAWAAEYLMANVNHHVRLSVQVHLFLGVA